MRDIQAVVDLQPLIARGRSLCANGGQIRLVAPPPPPPPSQNAGPPTYRVEDDRIGGGFFAIAEANDIVAGARPELALGCAPGQRHFVNLHLISEPRTPPPLRGVFAEFQVGDRTFRYEMSWGLNDDWTLRSGDDRAEDTELVRAIVAEGSVEFRGDPTFMPARASWDLNGFGEQLERIRTSCAE